MRAVVLLLALVAAAAAAGRSCGAAARADGLRERRSIRTAARSRGSRSTDFVVKEDGASREVLRAGRTADPIDLAVIVDTSTAIQPHLNDFRKALTAFVTRMAETAFGQRGAPVHGRPADDPCPTTRRASRS